MLTYWVSYDKEGRIHTVNAMDDSLLATHPEKHGNARLLLMRKGKMGESIPDHQLYAKIESQGGRRHYVEDFKIKPKHPLKLSIDKAAIKADGQDTATVTWEAPEPIQMLCNVRLKGRYTNMLKITSRTPDTIFTIEVDDPRYYSEPLRLRTLKGEKECAESQASQG